VIDVALLGIIRRWHIREQIPLREIARRLGISRNTVRRYLRSETIEPAYAERRSSRAIDKYTFQLSALLKTEAAKSRKQRRTLKQIHEDLKELGFEGSYDRVAAFARTWREGQTERVNPASKRTDDGAARPPHAPLPHHRNGQRQLPLQEQFNPTGSKGGQAQFSARITPKM
jgi:transcriptional regulator with XRE-family HTH domain